MSIMDKLKRWLRRTKAQVMRQTTFDVTDYWNGVCPKCGEHVGIDIMHNVASGELIAVCAACGANIFEEIK